MKLSPEVEKQITQSLILKPHVKKLIIKKWKTLGKKTQQTLISLVNDAATFQENLVKLAAFDKENFTTDFFNQIKNKRNSSIKRIEKSERKQELSSLDSLFSNMK